MMSTRQVLEDRTYVLSYIVNEQKGLDILKILINTSTEYVRAHVLGTLPVLLKLSLLNPEHDKYYLK